MQNAQILARFSALRALVLGDLCLDRWCRYDPRHSAVSRETEIPRVAVVATETTPGAAGTIASNLASLGAGRVAVLAAIGCDGHGWELAQALQARAISDDFLVRSPRIATFTYTKLINSSTGIEDLPRVDFINSDPLDEEIETQLLENLRRAADDFDLILVSDQAENETGVITSRIRDALAPIGKPVWADSRAHAEHFRNVILKLNREESEAACRRIGHPRLRDHTRSPLMIVTDGPRGAVVIDDAGETQVPTRPIENPVDICGAGDSFTAGAAMAYAVTGSALEAARFGNLVASITIMKKGTGTATPAEVLTLL